MRWCDLWRIEVTGQLWESRLYSDADTSGDFSAALALLEFGSNGVAVAWRGESCSMLPEDGLASSSSRVSQSSGALEVLLELRLRGGDSMDLLSAEETVSILGGWFALFSLSSFQSLVRWRLCSEFSVDSEELSATPDSSTSSALDLSFFSSSESIFSMVSSELELATEEAAPDFRALQ